jgi:hypothetical protein
MAMALSLSGDCPCMSSATRNRTRPAASVGLVLVARVGDVVEGCPFPPGTQTAECGQCKAAVWITPLSLDVVKAAGCRPELLCNRCAGM